MIRVPATTANLGPGFDAFGAAVGLHLEVEVVDRGSQDARVVVSGEGAGELSDGDDNLVWRAFLAGCAHLGVEAPDLALRVTNAIPLERGLGSSAAAIVAGLALTREVFAAPLADATIIGLAADLEGHPDNVAPAVLGGIVCVARDDDGDLVVRRVSPTRRLRPILLVPDVRQATVAARAVLPDALGRDAVVDQAARAGHVLAGLAGLWPVEPSISGDRLHEPPRSGDGTGTLLRALRGAGHHAWLSGAGPAVCVAVPIRDEAAHVHVDALARDHGCAAYALAWDHGGARTT